MFWTTMFIIAYGLLCYFGGYKMGHIHQEEILMSKMTDDEREKFFG